MAKRFKPPFTTAIIGDLVWTFVWYSYDDRIRADLREYGYSDYEEQEIGICYDQCPSSVVNTFNHEVKHAIEATYDIDMIDANSELHTRITALAWGAFWRVNPKVHDWHYQATKVAA